MLVKVLSKYSQQCIGCCILSKRLGLEVNVIHHMGLVSEHTLRQGFTWESLPGLRQRKDSKKQEDSNPPIPVSSKDLVSVLLPLFDLQKGSKILPSLIPLQYILPFQSQLLLFFFLPFLQISRGPISPELKSCIKFSQE